MCLCVCQETDGNFVTKHKIKHRRGEREDRARARGEGRGGEWMVVFFCMNEGHDKTDRDGARDIKKRGESDRMKDRK